MKRYEVDDNGFDEDGFWSHAEIHEWFLNNLSIVKGRAAGVKNNG